MQFDNFDAPNSMASIDTKDALYIIDFILAIDNLDAIFSLI